MDLMVQYVQKKISKVRFRSALDDSFSACSGEQLVTGSWDDPENSVSLWQFQNGNGNLDIAEDRKEPKRISEVSHVGSVTDLDVCSSDIILAASSVGNVSLYKVESGSLVKAQTWEKVHYFPDRPAACTSLAVDYTEVATVGEDSRLVISNLETGQNIRNIENCNGPSTIIYAKHKEVVIGSILGTIELWDLQQSSKPAQSVINPDINVGVTCLARHPMQSHVVVSGREDGTISIWDLRQLKMACSVLDAHTSPVMELKFHPTNTSYLYSCSMDGSLFQCNATTPKSALAVIEDSSSPESSQGVSWLNCEASKHKLEVASLLPAYVMCVNSLDIHGSTLVCSSDSEALYILNLSNINHF